MTLADLIARLEAADPTQVVRHGFTNPHSYRGDYMDLAFEPATDVPVAAMLAAARSALGQTFQGYKGGDFTMDQYSWCWLSEEGDASGETISALLLDLLLATPAAAVLPVSVDRAADAERPLSPDYQHPECGFHWHGRDGMDIPMRDGQPVCPRCEINRLQEKHKASLRRADEINNELMEEVQRYAAGTERPVLWSVYNRMHLRAIEAETELDELRRAATETRNTTPPAGGSPQPKQARPSCTCQYIAEPWIKMDHAADCPARPVTPMDPINILGIDSDEEPAS